MGDHVISNLKYLLKLLKKYLRRTGNYHEKLLLFLFYTYRKYLHEKKEEEGEDDHKKRGAL